MNRTKEELEDIILDVMGKDEMSKEEVREFYEAEDELEKTSRFQGHKEAGLD